MNHRNVWHGVLILYNNPEDLRDVVRERAVIGQITVVLFASFINFLFEKTRVRNPE